MWKNIYCVNTPIRVKEVILLIKFWLANFLYWPKDVDLLVGAYVTQATTKSIEDIYCAMIHVRFSFSLLFKDAVSHSDFATSNEKRRSWLKSKSSEIWPRRSTWKLSPYKDYVMLCYVMLCYVMLCYVMLSSWYLAYKITAAIMSHCLIFILRVYSSGFNPLSPITK